MQPVFNPLDHPAAFAEPELLSEQPAWQGHIPFAMALISLTRPGLAVELGVYKGDSYCAFCQAAAALSLGTRLFGIDTFEGDPHSDPYEPGEVLPALKAHHDPRYGAFSTIVQATFDQARPDFAEGSIDLLHIDGLHTYEAVKHDFETWLPAMSPRGVVLLHDTRVFERGFGVHRLMAELADKYPCLEFPHSHGLGVLLTGEEAPPELAALFELDEAGRAGLYALFEALGERVHLLRRLREAGTEHAPGTADLETRLARSEEERAALAGELRAKTSELDAIYASLGWRLRDRLNRVRRAFKANKAGPK